MGARFSGEAGMPVAETAGTVSAAGPWDPYQVWLERIKEPRERRSGRATPEVPGTAPARQSLSSAVNSRPLESMAPRSMPAELKGIAIRPSRSTTITPP